MVWVSKKYKTFEDVVRGLGCIVCRNQGRFSATDSLVSCVDRNTSSQHRFFHRIPLCRVHYREGGLGVAVYGLGYNSKALIDRSVAVFESKFGTLQQLYEQVEALRLQDPRSFVAPQSLMATIPLEFAEFAAPTVPDYVPLEGCPVVAGEPVAKIEAAVPLQGQLLEAHGTDDLPGQTPLGLLMVQAEEAKAELDLLLDEYVKSRTPKNEERLREQRLAYLACCRQVTELMMGGDAPLG